MIGSERLDPGGPTSPRPAITGRPGACRKWRAPPSTSFYDALRIDVVKIRGLLEPACVQSFQDCFLRCNYLARKGICPSFGVRSFYGRATGW